MPAIQRLVGSLLAIKTRGLTATKKSYTRSSAPAAVHLASKWKANYTYFFASAEWDRPQFRPQFREDDCKCLSDNKRRCGRNSVAECSLPKADVVGSNPIARSYTPSLPDGVFCCLLLPVTRVNDGSL